MEQEPKQPFRNTTDGQVGVITVNRRGEEVPIAVAPGDTIKLSVEEQELTAGAHRDPASSPFLPQTQNVLDPDTGDVVNTVELPFLEKITDKPVVPGVDAVADTPPPQGSYAPGEVQGTPVG